MATVPFTLAPFTLILVELAGWLFLVATTGGGILEGMEGEADDGCEEAAPFVCTTGRGGRLILGGSGGGTAVTTTGAIAATQQSPGGDGGDRGQVTAGGGRKMASEYAASNRLDPEGTADLSHQVRR